MRGSALVPVAAATLLIALHSPVHAQEPEFPRGELSTAKNHTGDVWLKELSAGDSSFDSGIAVATFAPGAKLDWHVHPGGQVLVMTRGSGFYQERGKPARRVRTGDVVKSAPGVEHWHGATPEASFAYFAVTPTQRGKTIWLKPVIPEEYAAAK